MAFYEDITEINEKMVTCLLCNISLENNSQVIDLHIIGDKHKNLYVDRILILNNIYHNFCNLCNCYIKDIGHIESMEHKEHLQLIFNLTEKDGAFIELPTKILQTWAVGNRNTIAHCTICDQFVDFTFKSIQSHIQNKKHIRSRAMALQPFNGIFSVQGSTDDLWCKICQKYFPNYIEKIFEHVDDRDHVIALNKIVRLIEGQSIMIDNYLTNPTEDKASCNRCKTHVSCNVDNLERHIKGKRHKSALT